MVIVIDILNRKFPQFNTVTSNHYVSDALHQMCAENVDHLIVMENDTFLGILTERDVTCKMLYTNKSLDELKVGDILNKNLPIASMRDSVQFCIHLLEQHNARYVAIYDNFTFKGVVSLNDLMHELLSYRDFEQDVVSQKEEYSWNY